MNLDSLTIKLELVKQKRGFAKLLEGESNSLLKESISDIVYFPQSSDLILKIFSIAKGKSSTCYSFNSSSSTYVDAKILNAIKKLSSVDQLLCSFPNRSHLFSADQSESYVCSGAPILKIQARYIQDWYKLIVRKFRDFDFLFFVSPDLSFGFAIDVYASDVTITNSDMPTYDVYQWGEA
jgi:hypothetical protein